MQLKKLKVRNGTTVAACCISVSIKLNRNVFLSLISTLSALIHIDILDRGHTRINPEVLTKCLPKHSLSHFCIFLLFVNANTVLTQVILKKKLTSNCGQISEKAV